MEQFNVEEKTALILKVKWYGLMIRHVEGEVGLHVTRIIDNLIFKIPFCKVAKHL